MSNSVNVFKFWNVLYIATTFQINCETPDIFMNNESQYIFWKVVWKNKKMPGSTMWYMWWLMNRLTGDKQDINILKVSGTPGCITRNNVCLTYRSRPGVYFLTTFWWGNCNTLLLLIYCSILFNYCPKKYFDMAQGTWYR